ncbi:MAG: galactokinase [Sphingobacteriales bacterium]
MSNEVFTIIMEEYKKKLVQLNSFITNDTIVVRSPGRINLIGEHTDYNEGFVLPAAIDKAIYVAVNKREDSVIQLYSVDYKEEYSVLLNEIKPTKSWATYILGVVQQLKDRGYFIGGFSMAIDGDVPIGAGLSSSAAIECATVYALNELFSLRIKKMEMALIAQKAEHEFAGVQCGIMDQFASMFGKVNHAIRLDCRSLEYQYVPFSMRGIKIVLLDTNVKHSLASSEYNVRRQQCEKGVELVKAHLPQVKSLRDVTLDMLEKFVLPNDKIVYNRCKYVVEENARLQSACMDLEKNDIKAFGKKMFNTHFGLSDLYEVSCKELDFLVEEVKGNPSVLGARMMGGGFGGCTINLVKEEAVEELVNKVSMSYKKVMKKDLKAYIAVIADGTSVIELNSGKLSENVYSDN